MFGPLKVILPLGILLIFVGGVGGLVTLLSMLLFYGIWLMFVAIPAERDRIQELKRLFGDRWTHYY